MKKLKRLILAATFTFLFALTLLFPFIPKAKATTQFTTVNVTSVHTCLLDQTTFVVAYSDDSNDDISFQIYDTNGTNKILAYSLSLATAATVEASYSAAAPPPGGTTISVPATIPEEEPPPENITPNIPVYPILQPHETPTINIGSDGLVFTVFAVGVMCVAGLVYYWQKGKGMLSSMWNKKKKKKPSW